MPFTRRPQHHRVTIREASGDRLGMAARDSQLLRAITVISTIAQTLRRRFILRQ